MHVQLRDIILLIHILLGISWLGGILFVGWGVYPAANKLGWKAKRHFLYTMMKQTHILLTMAGSGVILTGIILGTVYGPIQETHALTSTLYGQLFSSAFILALFGLLWGAFISYRVTMNMLRDDQIWNAAINGEASLLNEHMQRVTLISSVEVGCLILVVFIMVLI